MYNSSYSSKHKIEYAIVRMHRAIHKSFKLAQQKTMYDYMMTIEHEIDISIKVPMRNEINRTIIDLVGFTHDE